MRVQNNNSLNTKMPPSFQASVCATVKTNCCFCRPGILGDAFLNAIEANKLAKPENCEPIIVSRLRDGVFDLFCKDRTSSEVTTLPSIVVELKLNELCPRRTPEQDNAEGLLAFISGSVN